VERQAIVLLEQFESELLRIGIPASNSRAVCALMKPDCESLQLYMCSCTCHAHRYCRDIAQNDTVSKVVPRLLMKRLQIRSVQLVWLCLAESLLLQMFIDSVAQQLNGARHILRLENGRTAHNHIGASSGSLFNGVRSNAAIHLNV